MYNSFSRTKKNLPFQGLYEAQKLNVFHNTQQIAGGVLASSTNKVRTGTYSGSVNQPQTTQNLSQGHNNSLFQVSISTTGHNLSNPNISQHEVEKKVKPKTAIPSKSPNELPVAFVTGSEFYSHEHSLEDRPAPQNHFAEGPYTRDNRLFQKLQAERSSQNRSRELSPGVDEQNRYQLNNSQQHKHNHSRQGSSAESRGGIKDGGLTGIHTYKHEIEYQRQKRANKGSSAQGKVNMSYMAGPRESVPENHPNRDMSGMQQRQNFSSTSSQIQGFKKLHQKPQTAGPF